MDDLDKILQRTVYDHGCWVFTGCKNRGGYGLVTVNGGGTRLTHRVAFTTMNGAIPAGLDLDHLCRNRACCNPLHLEAVTRAENARRGAGGGNQRSKTHCPVGHPYDDGNTVQYVYSGRLCRECARLRAEVRNERVRAAKSARIKIVATHCKHGHELTEENLYRYKDRSFCKPCALSRAVAQRERNKGT